MGLLFNWFFYDHGAGVNFFLYVVSILAVTAGFMMYWQKRISLSVLSLSIVAVIFSMAVFARANGFVQFLNIISVIYLLTLIGVLLWRPKRALRDFTGSDYLSRALQLPFSSIAELGRVLRKTATYNPQSKSAGKRYVMPVVRGILISLPVLAVFLLLFSSADLVFKRYVTSVFDFNISPDLVSHTILVLVVAAFFVGLYALLFTRSAPEEEAKTKTQSARIGNIEATIVLGSVVSLFLIFVMIQLHYLFGGQNNVISGGYTYADYARKGFFELIFVAIIAFLLLLALHISTIRRTIQQRYVFVALCSVLVLEVGLVMLSAHHRLSLYEEAYGFTELRLYSHLFIGWLVVASGLLLTYIVRDQPQKLFARSIFISGVVFIAVINLVNPHAFVARENIQRFNSTGKLDVPYLGSLSADATPELSGLLNSENKHVQQSVAYYLYHQQQIANESDQSWQAFNLSQQRAKQIREDHQDQLQASRLYPHPHETHLD